MPTSNVMLATSALPQVLVSQQLAATETTQYTCPANSSVKIAAGSLCNITGAAVTVGLSLLRSGQTADGNHRVIPVTFSLDPKDSLSLTELLAGHVLGPQDFISAIAGTANAVVLVLSGTVFS